MPLQQHSALVYDLREFGCVPLARSAHTLTPAPLRTTSPHINKVYTISPCTFRSVHPLAQSNTKGGGREGKRRREKGRGGGVRRTKGGREMKGRGARRMKGGEGGDGGGGMGGAYQEMLELTHNLRWLKVSLHMLLA